MSSLHLSLLAASALGFVQVAQSADLPIPYNPNSVEYKQISRVGSWQPLTGPTPGGNGVVFRSPDVSNATPKVVDNLRLTQAGRNVGVDGITKVPIGSTGKTVPVKVASLITPKAVLTGVAAAMVNPYVAFGLAVAAPLLQEWLSAGDIGINKDPADYPARPFTRRVDMFEDGKEYRVTQSPYPWASSRSAACAPLFQDTKSANPSMSFTFSVSGMNCVTTTSYGSSYNGLSSRDTQNTGSREVPASLDEILPYMDSSDSPLLTPGTVHQISKTGVDPFGAAEPVVTTSGPPSVPGSSSTTSSSTRVNEGTTTEAAPGTSNPTQPATKTTTTTTTHNVTYNNNNVTTNTTTTTTTNITNNVTNQTTNVDNSTEVKEEPPEDPDDKEDPAVDTPLGDIPALYERKYPDGLVGIWNQKSEIIKQSSAFTLASDLMPTALTAGTCPAWNINLDFTWWSSYGEHNVAPPCWIWDVAKGIIIISALMLARSLIFGG